MTGEWPLPGLLPAAPAARVTTPGEACGVGSRGVRVGWRTRALAHTRGRWAR